MVKDNYEKMYDTQSKYCYLGTNILINKADIRDAETLEKLDRLQTTYALSRLYLTEINGTFGIEHYKAIHKYLFNELYDFAGEFRYENISKDGIPFCRPEFVYRQLNVLLEQMKKQSYKISSEEELLEFLSYFYSEINLVHPFREGNGRTLREFIRQYVLEINKRISFGHYELDFSMLSENDKSMHILACEKSAINGDFRELKNFFKTCLVKANQKQL